MFPSKRIAAVGAVAGLAALGVAAMPSQANAWWRGPGFGISLWVPPVVVAPAPVYAPPPVDMPRRLRTMPRRLRTTVRRPPRITVGRRSPSARGCRRIGRTALGLPVTGRNRPAVDWPA